MVQPLREDGWCPHRSAPAVKEATCGVGGTEADTGMTDEWVNVGKEGRRGIGGDEWVAHISGGTFFYFTLSRVRHTNLLTNLTGHI